jgi:MoxR-like ATPase
MLNAATLEQWKKRLAAMRADRAFMAEYDQRDGQRVKVREEIRSLIRDFLTEHIELDRLRVVFDMRTRGEWDVFGLKGLSGAMFLNTLVKHLPAQSADITARLRAVLALPKSDVDARARMQSFHDRLVELIELNVTTRRHVQPSRVPFFVSAIWHLEAPQEWPAYYESMRKRLAEDGLFTRKEDDPVASYFHFAEVVRQLQGALGVDAWALERLCMWEAGSDRSDIVIGNGTDAPVEPSRREWLIGCGRGAEYWEEFKSKGLIAIGISGLGDLSRFRSHDEVRSVLRQNREDGTDPIQDALAAWEFAHEMKPGDVVFVKKGRSLILGCGVVESDYIHDTTRSGYHNMRRVKWLWTGEEKPRGKLLVTKTLTEITHHTRLLAQLYAIVKFSMDDAASSGAGGADSGVIKPPPPYTIEDAVNELFRSREELESLIGLVKHRKNVVLQGPPGVGKTFLASRLADLLVGRRDPEHVCFVQFHPSYAYEDFVQGYRPAKGGGFELRDGPFLRFCDQALQDKDDTYVLIIDEINRGNLGKVLGELMMLIETDKRDPRWATSLAYADEKEEPFYVPPNLYILGTMNTADRSLAMVDYALRRRFAFVDVEPSLDEPTFHRLLTSRGASPALIERIRNRVKKVNELIEKDESLGKGFLVGHSYFCGAPAAGGTCDDDWFQRIVDYELEPLLREYWFDRPKRAEEATALLLED